MTSAEPAVPRPGRREILIAEDDPLNRVLLATFLEEAGYRVGVAANGMQALKLIRESMPDLVITDVNMPEMNGLELCRRLRSHHKLARIPIIMLSGLVEPPEILAGYAEGADDYVGKPIDFAVLGAKIEALMQRSRDTDAGDPKAGVILFMHAKGGSGSTTLAVNLACLLQRISATGACVLDLSLGFGNAAYQLGLKPRLSLADLALQPTEEMTDAMFAKFISTVPGGPALVRAADRPEHGQLVSIPSIQLALAHLRERYQYILVDSPPSLSEHVLAAVDAADLVWAITGPTRAELTATRDLLKLFDRLEVAPGRRLLILDENRPDIPAVDAEGILGRRPDVSIRFSADIMDAIDSGAPLAQSAPDAESLGTIAELAAGLEDRLLRAAGRNPARGLARKAQASP
ncbi:MAG: response regulator [Candidatus Dormibacteraeota bacterium]|nr:response regulator [Candidatus Dormibacteraeota bacterium]